MEPLSRRGALTLGGLGLAATAVGGAGLLWLRASAPPSSGDAPFPGAPAPNAPPAGNQLSQPAEFTSANGRLALTLDAARGPLPLAGRDATALGYNGTIPGPTLRLRPGDRLAVRLNNGLDDTTNLHLHGLHVSPEGNADNPFVMVAPGDSFDYEYRLPGDHPPGVYWYHPHHHGLVADQIFGGMYGAIVVEDPERIDTATERMLLVADVTLDALGRIPAVAPMQQMLGREGELVLVNGQLNPSLGARPGERERWRIVNACVSRYLRLRLDGQRMELLGIDSGRFARPETVDEIVLAPGNRADLLVTMVAGTAVLETLPYDRGHPGGMMGGGGRPRSGTPAGRAVLASLTVAGDEAQAAPAVPAQRAPRDLRGETVTARRELTFAMGMGGGMGGGMMRPTINGREYDGGRVDITALSGSVEEWTLTNISPMDHPMHLHVWPMQVVEGGSDAGTGAGATDAAVWRDVVNIPAFGSVRVRIAFDDVGGRTVYHCHILDHEDSGMMGVIEVRQDV